MDQLPELWLYLSGRLLLLWVAGGWLTLAVCTTLLALVMPRPKTRSFTLSWPQRAGLAWGVGALAVVYVAGELGWFRWLLGLFGYLSLTTALPAALRHRLGDQVSRRTLERAELGVHALLTVVCILVAGMFINSGMERWREAGVQRQRQAEAIAGAATFSGFPRSVQNARARILHAERSVEPEMFDESYFDSTCERLRFAKRSWLICKAGGQVTGVILISRTLGGQGLDKAVAADSRFLLWVVTGQDLPETAAELAADVGSSRARKAKVIGDVQITGGGVDFQAHRVSAWPVGVGPPDTTGISVYTY